MAEGAPRAQSPYHQTPWKHLSGASERYATLAKCLQVRGLGGLVGERAPLLPPGTFSRPCQVVRRVEGCDPSLRYATFSTRLTLTWHPHAGEVMPGG